jgi:DNA polymerase III epsilon subunit-like protein
MTKAETWFSVDIEAAGPVPGEYSMLSLGACLVRDTAQSFYVELKPITRNVDPSALAVAGFDLEQLAREGTDPADAMPAFAAWVEQLTPPDSVPVFAAYPLAFDWMFVAYYLHRFAGRNPFGYSGFDVKSFYMGASGVGWRGTSVKHLLDVAVDLTHNAREDAIAQAELLVKLFQYADQRQRYSERPRR